VTGGDLFQSTFDCAPVGMAHVSLDGRFLRVNDRLCEIAGYSREELVGTSFPDITHPEDLAADLRQADRLGRGEIGRYGIEKRYLRKDGSPVWVELHGSLLRDEAGEPLCFVAVVHEIGDRKRLEAELREGWERAALAERVAHFGTWERSLTGPEGWWSPECYRIFGVAEDAFEPTYENFLALVHPDDRAGLREAVEACARGGGLLRHEYRIVRPDGAERTIHSAALVLRDKEGLPSKLAGVLHDVTEQRQAEEQVRASERRLRTLADAMPQLVWTARPDGAVDYCNSRFEEYTAISQGRDGAWEWRPLIHPEDLERTERGWSKALASGQVYQVEHRVRRRDGVYGWHLTRAVPLRDDRGEILKWFGTSTDIEALKSAEEELRLARDDARAAADAKSRFLANMSHEIRTPLGGVLGMAELLGATHLTPEQRECLEAIRLSGKLLLGIVNDVLDFSRIESAGVALETVSFALRQTLEDTVHLQAEAAHAKGLELCCRVGPDVPARVRGDPGRLGQVLFNLVGNAVKFTERGQVVVRAALAEAPGSGEGALLRVEVEDTGVGIPEPVHARLFEAFTQGDPSTTRRFGGSGLGLAISRRLVTAMGGDIGFRSAPGRGSTFWFTVRVVPEEPARQPESSLAEIRALTVVPHPVSRTFLQEQLARWGAQTVGASGRAEAARLAAQAAAERQPFGLAVVELDLPDGSGLELARELEGRQEWGTPGVVLLAPFTAQGLAAKALEAEGVCFLVKPPREQDLGRCIGAVLAQRPASSLEGVPPAPVAPRVAGDGRILLAEDNPVNQTVVVRFLELLGYRTDLVEDGASAVEAALSGTYDLVLMDWQMPGMDGLSAAREIRRREAAGRRVPIVALTAHALPEHREACLAAGMDGYLTKPLALAELARTLERWAKRPGAGAGSAPREEQPPAPAGFEAFEGRLAELARDLPPGVLGRLVDLFLHTSSQGVSALAQAVQRGDAKAVAREAHTFRGSCSPFGGGRLADLASELEQRAAEGNLEGAETRVAALTEELERLRSFLEARRPGLGA
jgi:PAS domain S-box-containing protein